MMVLSVLKAYKRHQTILLNRVGFLGFFPENFELIVCSWGFLFVCFGFFTWFNYFSVVKFPLVSSSV